VSTLNIPLLIRKVDLLTLRLFLAAIEERQIGRAAARENIAASAATKRIQDLEDMIGERVLERRPAGVAPTAVGRLLAVHARRIFGHLDAFRRELDEVSEGVRGRLRLASSKGILIQNLAREIGVFTTAFPLVELEIREDVNPAVHAALLAGDADLAFLVAAPDLESEAMATIPWRRDRLVAVCPTGDPLAARTSVTLADLLDAELVTLPDSTTLMTRLHAAARAIGRSVPSRLSVASAEAAQSLVRAGLGVTVQPEWMVANDDAETLATVPIAEPWAQRDIGIGVLKGQPLVPAARLLVQQLTR
jgi:DNA-binding transcriptional LysR family regulator